MGVVERLAGFVTGHSRITIAVLLVATLVMAAGLPQLGASAGIQQFEGDSAAAQKQSYVNSNFTTFRENTTGVQIIIRGDNVLRKQTLVDTLELQRAFRENQTVNESLTADRPTFGIANLLALAAIRQERVDNLTARGEALQERSDELNETFENLAVLLNRSREIEADYLALNASLANGSISNETYDRRAAELDRELQAVYEAADRNLTDAQDARFEPLVPQIRLITKRLAFAKGAYEQGKINESIYDRQREKLEEMMKQVYEDGLPRVARSEIQDLTERGIALQERQAELRNASTPTLEEQLTQLRSMNQSEINDTITSVLTEDAPEGGLGARAFLFMPTDYEPESTQASATMVFVFQRETTDNVITSLPEKFVTTQKMMRDIAEREVADGELVMFGGGLLTGEMQQSMRDSIQMVGPLALLFVLLTLVFAYRDLVDILLGLFGLVLVLFWALGFMGWAGMSFSQVLIAVPVLLIGLSIDYGIHVFMRYRESRETGEESVRGGMNRALFGVGAALVWVTTTAVIGFVSNVVSPIGQIQQFGLISGVGIVGALVVFGGLIPAIKVEIDGFLESRGLDRRKSALGTGGGRLASALSVGAVAARKAPLAVIAIALLVSAGGAYGSTQVSTTFGPSDFFAEEPPDWTENLPGPMKTQEYHVKEDLNYINANFIRESSEAEVLVEGDVTDPATLEKLERVREMSVDTGIVVILSNGDPETASPLSAIEETAASNETFNETLAAADTDGDGVPDRNVEEVYDALYAADESAAQQVIYRDDGEYKAVRMVIDVKGTVHDFTVSEEIRGVVAAVDWGDLEATATGTPVVQAIIRNRLLDTVVQSLLVSLLAVFLFLAAAYRFAHGSASLGVVTLVPVALCVTWILGSMYLLGLPLSVLTGTITSLTIGLGVAYTIHLSERYYLELQRTGSVHEAMERAVQGTGGALLGSALTTAIGFGVLAFAITPLLQQFGSITAVTILYAFLAAVLVLPSILVLWTRYLGPDLDELQASGAGTPAAADGGERT